MAAENGTQGSIDHQIAFVTSVWDTDAPRELCVDAEAGPTCYTKTKLELRSVAFTYARNLTA